ncbi:hypothetical protein [Gimesia panareensis]|uniref:hypothetical protein n=1 Tax=Gimesia panareensis TaxID=2527978 RepID=UPI00118BE277|nr:hypothetical protein [Gimesia panareensis]QDU50078.1 hypothetical protein Pan110_24200 [Gimesia panareensis]
MLQNASQGGCVLVLGNSRTEEMRGVLQSVQDAFPKAEMVSVSRLSELDAQTVQPELVLICQNWPDEFSGQTLTELVRRFPVSRFLCCFSVWCEADGRTRNQWPVSIRVPARAADFRIRQEAEVIRGTAPAYPLTAGRDEIFQYQVEAGLETTTGSLAEKRIGVISADPPYRKMLEALVLSWGATIAVPSLLCQADLWLYDLDPWEVVQTRLLTQGEMPACIGLMGLSHPETVTAARLLGVDAVVSKLAPVQELFAAVTRGLQLKGTPQAER